MMEDSLASSSTTDNPATANSVKGGLSAAELRERRRQKILSNQSSRLSMITGGGGGGFGVKVSKDLVQEDEPVQQSGEAAEDPPDEVLDWTKFSRPGELKFEEETVDDHGGVTLIRRRITRDEHEFTSMKDFNDPGKNVASTMSSSTSTTTTTIKSSINLKAKAGSPTNPSKTVTFAPGTATAPSTSTSFSSSSSSSSRPAVGFMSIQADGSTIHPKLSNRACRILVLILGLCLALLNAKYFLVTFCSWEVAVFLINGFPNDEESSSSSNLILLVALLGMKERNLTRFKLALKLSNCLVTDFSILMVSSLTCRVLLENYMGTRALK